MLSCCEKVLERAKVMYFYIFVVRMAGFRKAKLTIRKNNENLEVPWSCKKDLTAIDFASVISCIHLKQTE